jgi:uncharacterized protein (TIGR03437 family)
MLRLTVTLALIVPVFGSTLPGDAYEAYGRLPLSFSLNQGQLDPQVKFVSHGKRSALFLTSDQAVLALDDATVRIGFVDSNKHVQVDALDQLPGTVNYFIGRDPAGWRTNVPTYARVRYREVWRGIDLVFYGNQGRLEYDFVVSPGADPNQVRLRFDGADSLRVEENRLIAEAGDGNLIQLSPVVYQDVEGERHEIAGRYKLEGSEVVFELGAYDEKHPLVIDPILIYASYLGGSIEEAGFGIDVDSSGSAYVTGPTLSPDFPTAGPFQVGFHGPIDAFVTKINAAGSVIVYSTYLGGDGVEFGFDVEVDSEGQAYVIGDTHSTDFPITAGAAQTVHGGDSDAFVCKLNPTGNRLIYSTYLGGADVDAGWSLALNAAGEVFATGRTASGNFPVTPGVFQPALGGGDDEPADDAYVTRVKADGTEFLYSTYLGGSAMDHGNRIAIDSNDHAYIAGRSLSDDFPTTAGSFQPGRAGDEDAIIVKINPTGSDLVYSTYLGGSADDIAYGIAVDFANQAYVIGDTRSSGFPVTANAVQPALSGDSDAFVAKLNDAGSEIVYATYLGGTRREHGHAVAVDTATTAYLIGYTISDNFPEANPLPDTKFSADIFVARLNHDATSLHFSTYYGGIAPDFSGPGGNTIAIDENCQIYATGETMSPNLPTRVPFQAQLNGQTDAFVLKIDPFVENDGPSINCRGGVLATGTPLVRKVSPNSIVTVFGDEYTDGASALSAELDQDGNIARTLAGACVELNGERTPLFAALATQVNFQAHGDLAAGWAKLQVVRDCGTANEVKSPPEYVQVMPTTPAFFNLVNNADGVNPIAALHQDGVSIVGPPGLFGSAAVTTEAAPGEFISMFFTGGGMTNPSFAEGEIPGVAAVVTAPVEMTIGGLPVTGGDLPYVGVAACCAGLYQAVGRVPAGAMTGNNEVRLKVGEAISPPGPFIAVKAP